MGDAVCRWAWGGIWEISVSLTIAVNLILVQNIKSVENIKTEKERKNNTKNNTRTHLKWLPEDKLETTEDL